MPIATCPQCRKRFWYESPSECATFPFCCERCKMVDLGGWLTERYRIPEPLEDGDLPLDEDDE